jgi:hypothetical protein
MRPTLFRRFVAGLAALAFIVTLGLQGMQSAAMATMKSEMSMSLGGASGNCANRDGSEKGAVMQCQTVSICAPSFAVLQMAESISADSEPARVEAENTSFDGRTGRPEPHPPKSAALL